MKIIITDDGAQCFQGQNKTQDCQEPKGVQGKIGVQGPIFIIKSSNENRGFQEPK